MEKGYCFVALDLRYEEVRKEWQLISPSLRPPCRFSQKPSRERDPVRRKISGMLRGTMRKSRSLFVDEDKGRCGVTFREPCAGEQSSDIPPLPPGLSLH